jgi:hypothetical protein
MPDEDTWKLLSHASASTTVVDVTLRSTDDSGGPVGSAAARKLSFADDDLQGGPYYWAAASGSILRCDFGLCNQTAEKFYTAGQSGSTCVGCHGLSRNGARIRRRHEHSRPAELRTLDAATRSMLFDSCGMGIPEMATGGSGRPTERASSSSATLRRAARSARAARSPASRWARS